MKQSPRNAALGPPSRSDVLSAITSMKESIRPEVSELACLLSVPVFPIRRTPHHLRIQNLPEKSSDCSSIQGLISQIIRQGPQELWKHNVDATSAAAGLYHLYQTHQYCLYLPQVQ